MQITSSLGTFAILASMYFMPAIENFSASTAARQDFRFLGFAVDYHLFSRNYCCLHSGIRFYPTLYCLHPAGRVTDTKQRLVGGVPRCGVNGTKMESSEPFS